MIFLAKDSKNLSSEILSGIHKLRYTVFHNRLQWDVSTTGNEEHDYYDKLNPVFIAAMNLNGRIDGCCRLLPTSGPYMLSDTFPILLGSRSAPRAKSTWEISRFAVVKEPRNGMNFSTIPSRMIAHVIFYALEHGIRDYVFVTTVGFERLLLRMGVNCERFSEPQMIGIERSVALCMHIDKVTINAASTILPELFIERRAVA